MIWPVPGTFESNRYLTPDTTPNGGNETRNSCGVLESVPLLLLDIGEDGLGAGEPDLEEGIREKVQEQVV